MGAADRPQTRVEIERAIRAEMDGARHVGQPYVDVTSGPLHRRLGGYTGRNHRMPMVCGVMRAMMRDGDTIIQQPPKGNGATLTIRYILTVQ